MFKNETDELTSIIYKHLFDLDRNELIRIVRGKLGKYSVDDEMARDMMSIEALQALAEVESRCAEMYRKATYGNMESFRAITHHVAGQYGKVEKLWDE